MTIVDIMLCRLHGCPLHPPLYIELKTWWDYRYHHVRRWLWCRFPFRLEFGNKGYDSDDFFLLTPLFWFRWYSGAPDMSRLNTYMWGWYFGWTFKDLPLRVGQLITVSARRVYVQHLAGELVRTGRARPQLHLAVREQ